LIVWGILSTFLFILLGLVLAILLVPITYRIHARRVESILVKVRIGWLLGFIRTEGVWLGDTDLSLWFGLVGLRFNLMDHGKRAIGARRKKNKLSKGKKRSKKKKESLHNNRFSRVALSLVLSAGTRCLCHVRPHVLKAWGRIGFDDPYHTGIACALFETTYSVGWHDMQVEFVFNEEVYEGEIDLAGRIMIGYLLCQAIWLFLHKPSRQLLLG